MAKALYLVIHSQAKWWVDFEGTPHGPFDTREEAALEARNLARFQVHSGREAEVLVPDGDGRYWVIWSSRHDSGDGQGFIPRRIGA
ncbi:MAG: hypothetical protein EON57_10125 [Alphaproteobacteria bacterium]|nr:MAG: hypothetical protein EON57_10125 [Alphaproteobacteria bacterium]